MQLIIKKIMKFINKTQFLRLNKSNIEIKQKDKTEIK